MYLLFISSKLSCGWLLVAYGCGANRLFPHPDPNVPSPRPKLVSLVSVFVFPIDVKQVPHFCPQAVAWLWRAGLLSRGLDSCTRVDLLRHLACYF